MIISCIGRLSIRERFLGCVGGSGQGGGGAGESSGGDYRELWAVPEAL